MPLPDGNSPWPLPVMAPVQNDIAKWSAWWVGDPDILTQVYGGGNTSTEQSFTQNGLLGTARNSLRRFFWGQPATPGEQRSKIHVPLAAEIAQVSADLLFGHPPTITVPDTEADGDTPANPVAVATQQRIDELLGEQAHTQFHEAAEAVAALGHGYLRVGWDRDIEPTMPLLSTVDADAALPVYRYGRLVEATFVREWAENSTVLRHLELHEPGIIWHAAYLGTPTSLGRMVPLGAYPQTAGLVVDGMVADDTRPGSGILTGIDRLDVVGVANARSRAWRHLADVRDLGRSDISGVESELDALDDTMSSWMRDVRHGRSRIHVPAHMMDTRGRGQGATVDLDREVYVPLTSPPDGALQLTATQFKIRHEEHRATAQALIERIVSGAGYSPQTFGLDGDSALTATESWARQVRTQNTRNAKIRRWRRALVDLTRIMLDIDRVQFGGKGDPSLAIDVDFADTVSESQMARAQSAQFLRNADAASTETLVAMVHNDWDSERVADEVARIVAERGTAPDPIGLFDALPRDTPSSDTPTP